MVWILIQFVNFGQIALLQRCKSIFGKIHVDFFVVIFQLVQMNGAWTDCYLSITSDFPPRSAPPRRKSCVIKPSCDGPRHPLDRWSKNLGGRNRKKIYNISSSHWCLGKSICANNWKWIDRQENFKLFCEPQLQLESFLLWQRWKGAIQNYKKVLEASIVNAKGKTCNLHIGLSSKTTNNHLWTAPSAGQKDILCDLSHPHGPKTYFNGQQEENELIKNSKSKRGQQNYLQTPYLFTWLEILAVKMWEVAWRGIIFNIV